MANKLRGDLPRGFAIGKSEARPFSASLLVIPSLAAGPGWPMRYSRLHSNPNPEMTSRVPHIDHDSFMIRLQCLRYYFTMSDETLMSCMILNSC
jgi:hypothetical protein